MTTRRTLENFGLGVCVRCEWAVSPPQGHSQDGARVAYSMPSSWGNLRVSFCGGPEVVLAVLA